MLITGLYSPELSVLVEQVGADHRSYLVCILVEQVDADDRFVI